MNSFILSYSINMNFIVINNGVWALDRSKTQLNYDLVGQNLSMSLYVTRLSLDVPRDHSFYIQKTQSCVCVYQ